MEMHRKQNIVRNQILKGPEIERKIQLVQKEIRNEGSIIKKLCSDLEDPKNYNRWKEPKGDDLDQEQLVYKMSMLEKRFSDGKEILLEKELILEESTMMTTKLKHLAGDGKQVTLAVAQSVNDYQGRVRDITRKLMAVISELSMYQATSVKLQE